MPDHRHHQPPASLSTGMAPARPPSAASLGAAATPPGDMGDWLRQRAEIRGSTLAAGVKDGVPRVFSVDVIAALVMLAPTVACAAGTVFYPRYHPTRDMLQVGIGLSVGLLGMPALAFTALAAVRHAVPHIVKTLPVIVGCMTFGIVVAGVEIQNREADEAMEQRGEVSPAREAARQRGHLPPRGG